jgi:Zn-dependent M28 family amino/carboxypeptidase
MRARALAPLLVASVLLAGCAQTPTSGPAQAASVSSHDALLAALRADPAPALDGARVQAWLDKFVNDHHPRLTGTPLEKVAGDDLEAQAKALGYETSSKRYSANGLPSVDGPLRVVLAVKKGTTRPDELIVVGGHYDTAPIGTPLVPGVQYGTPPITATYDNGSGTAMVMELARLLANVTTERTLVFAFFNGEEEGLLASGAYAQELQSSGARVVTYVGFDMVGIGWPSKAGCLCIYAGKRVSAELNPIQEAVAFDLLKYPRGNDTVQVFDNHDTRNSDEGSFAGAGFPTMRWAGLASAGRYWAYHKTNDTMDTMLQQAGGADALDHGFESAAASAYYTILAMDHEGMLAGGEG